MPQVVLGASKSFRSYVPMPTSAVIAAVIMQASNAKLRLPKPFGGNQNLTTSAQKFALGAIDSGVSGQVMHEA